MYNCVQVSLVPRPIAQRSGNEANVHVACRLVCMIVYKLASFPDPSHRGLGTRLRTCSM